MHGLNIYIYIRYIQHKCNFKVQTQNTNIKYKHRVQSQSPLQYTCKDRIQNQCTKAVYKETI
jgi:hypothetical protein